MAQQSTLGTLALFLLATVIGPSTAPSAARESSGTRTVQAKGIAFSWTHKDGRLFGRVSASTDGWIAVGFNRDRRLRGTRFVIGRVVAGKAQAEVHVAMVPDHAEVGALGGTADLRHVDGGRSGGQTWLTFSLPHRSGDPFDVTLAPESGVHLMLAWSRSPDFDHHSHFRTHRDVVL